MNEGTIFEPQRMLRMLKALCLIVLVFIPFNMLFSPVYDFFTVEARGTNWTVTMSAFFFIQVLLVFLAAALMFLKSRQEQLFLLCLIAFFMYAFSFTIYSASDLFYPLYGLVSALGSILVGLIFYVCVRENVMTPKVVVHFLAFASLFMVVPLILVQLDTERFGQLAQAYGGSNILYGYENPRALGWASTVCLSILAAYFSTQPIENRIRPVFLLLAVIAATTLFWSGSRGGIVAFTVSISFVFLFSKTRNYKGALSVFSCIAAGGAISYLLYLPSRAFGIFSRISENLDQESVAAMSNGRTDLWQLTISYILERPFTGYGYLPHKNLEGFTHGSAHNLALDAWLWFGVIIGTVILLLAVLLWGKAFAFFRKANDPHISALFCVVTALLAYCMVSGPYARTFPLMLFAIAAGVVFGSRSVSTKAKIDA